MAQVSVIVPTFNKKEQVREALQSVLDQKFQDIEILIADDGSTDGTPLALFKELGAQPEAIDVLAKMGNNSIRPFTHAFQCGGITVQYHYGINRGLSTARNRGIKSARGEYIAFLEPDDFWAPHHLSELISHLKRNREVKVCRVSERLIREGKSRAPKHPANRTTGWLFEASLDSSLMSISTVICHRSCFSICGCFDENMPACEEYDLWIRISSHFPIGFLDCNSVTRRTPRPADSIRAWNWDRFRVYALEKAFQSGHITPEQRYLVAQSIVLKCERLVEGFKRQKSDERSNFYERKRKRFTHEVRKLKSSMVVTAQA